MRDIALEETVYFDFTTRSFSTGVPTTLSGTPVLSVLEENNATPITSGVSVSVDRASVTGLNMATVVATAANGYESGKGYSVYISTGTVGGVSVVGEKVAEFTIEASAAAQDLANGTDGLGAIKSDTEEIGTAGAGLTDLGGMSTGMQAEVESEVNDALVALALDHLFNAAIVGADVTDNSFAAYLTSDSVTADFDDFDNTTDSLPAISSSVGNISIGTAAVSTVAESYTLTTGTQSSGTVSDTETVDGVHHQHTDTAGAMELYYQFDVTGSGVAVECRVVGRINGNNDSLDGVYAWDWTGASWDRVGDFDGQTSTVDVTRDFDLLVRHTGTGANLGKVRIRFFAASGLTSAELFVDRITTSYAVVAQSVGYANGAVWIDTNNGTAGTESFVNGTADNPVLTLADAITIASNVGLSRFQIINGSSLTFAETHSNESWMGNNWTLALGGQDCSGTIIEGANTSGVCTGTTPRFEKCTFGNTTVPPCRINTNSGFNGTLTLGSTGDYQIIECDSLVAEPSAFVIDMGAAVGATNLSMKGWKGTLTLNNVQAGDVISIEGTGGIITLNGTGGTVDVRGIFEDVIDNSSGAIDVTQTATINRKSLQGYIDGRVFIDASASNTGTVEYVDGTSDNPVSTLAAARTLADSLGLKAYFMLPGTDITLDENYDDWTFVGTGSGVDMGSQSILGARFEAGRMEGTSASGTGLVVARDLLILNPTFGNQTAGLGIELVGTMTLNAAATFQFTDFTTNNDTAVASFSNASARLELDKFSGHIDLQNMVAGNECEIIGDGFVTINANCTGGTLVWAGDVKVTDNAGGVVSVSNAVIGDIISDTNELQSDDVPGLIAALNDPSAAANAAALLAEIVETEGSYTLQQVLSVLLSVCAGVTSDSGATFKTPNGVSTRVAATTNVSNERTAMTITPSS